MTGTKTTVLNQNLCCRKSKQDRVIDATFGCYGDLYAEKYSMEFLWNSWNVLTRIHKKKRKKGHFLYIGGRAILIATGSHLLDTKYLFYGFNDDLRDIIN